MTGNMCAMASNLEKFEKLFGGSVEDSEEYR